MERRLLDEILNGTRRIESAAVIKNRGDNIVSSAITLFDDIEHYYGEDVVKLLERRLLNAIKQRNTNKFRFTKR